MTVKNSTRLGKIAVDFDCDICLVCVPNASYCCLMQKYSKKAGFVFEQLARELAIQNINFTDQLKRELAI